MRVIAVCLFFPGCPGCLGYRTNGMLCIYTVTPPKRTKAASTFMCKPPHLGIRSKLGRYDSHEKAQLFRCH